MAITYRSADGRRSERVLHPYGVVAHSGRWYAREQTRPQAERTFRPDRIGGVRPLDTFDAPDTDPEVRLLTALAEAPRRQGVAVLVRAAPQHIERRVPRGLAVVEPLAETSTGGDPWVRLRLQVEQLDWSSALLAWIDRPFVIEEPVVLRAQVHALAARLVRSADQAAAP